MFSGIESYGTEAVPVSLRQNGFLSPFLIMANFFINPATIITAAMGVAGGLSVLMVVAIQCLGVMLAMIAFMIMARIGVDYGLTGQMACRAAFGVRGGRWITSPLRVCCSVYWFAFQTQAGSLALAAILYQQWQMEIPLMHIAAVFALAQISVAVIGFSFLQVLFRWAFPLKIISLIILGVALRQQPASETSSFLGLPESQQQTLQMMLWFNAVFGSIMTIITDAADFSRYVRSRRALWFGGLLGSATGVIVAAAFGASLMAISGGALDQIFHRFLQINNSSLITLALLILLVLDNWTINVINLYSGGISLCHTLESLGRTRCTLIVSFLAVILSCFPVVIERYMTWAEAAGTLFAGIVGILLMDYQCRQWKLQIAALYEGAQLIQGGRNPYWYQSGFAVKTLLVLVAVVAIGRGLPEHWPVPLIIMILAAFFYRVFCFRGN